MAAPARLSSAAGARPSPAEPWRTEQRRLPTQPGRNASTEAIHPWTFKRIKKLLLAVSVFRYNPTLLESEVCEVSNFHLLGLENSMSQTVYFTRAQSVTTLFCSYLAFIKNKANKQKLLIHKKRQLN